MQIHSPRMQDAPRLRRLLREPLLHFLVLGALLFAAYGWLHRGAVDSANEIVVSRDQLASLEAQFKRVWERPPNAEELNGLIEGWVREEVLYRNGVALGLERDDPVVRRRIAQKVEFLADGQVPVAPTAEELQDWLTKNATKYQIEPSYTLRQIYFDPSRHGDTLDRDLALARRSLLDDKPVAGDSTMLPPTLQDAPESEIVRVFGTKFAEAIRDLKTGEWSAPVQSGFGVHLVEITQREAGRPAQLEEVRAAVERDFLHERNEAASAAFYRKLRASYTVRVEDAGVAASASGAGASTP